LFFGHMRRYHVSSSFICSYVTTGDNYETGFAASINWAAAKRSPTGMDTSDIRPHRVRFLHHVSEKYALPANSEQKISKKWIQPAATSRLPPIRTGRCKSRIRFLWRL
jgi:hypothetical protein